MQKNTDKKTIDCLLPTNCKRIIYYGRINALNMHGKNLQVAYTLSEQRQCDAEFGVRLNDFYMFAMNVILFFKIFQSYPVSANRITKSQVVSNGYSFVIYTYVYYKRHFPRVYVMLGRVFN